MNTAQQRGIHHPAPERIDQRKVRLRPDTDRENVDRPEQLITIRCWLQRPDEESVNGCIPDLADCLHRVNVQDRKGSIGGARLHDRLQPIRVAEPRAERPFFSFSMRTIPSKQTPDEPSKPEKCTHGRTQTPRLPDNLENGANVLHRPGRPTVRKVNAPDIVYWHIVKKAVGTKDEAVVLLNSGLRPGAHG